MVDTSMLPLPARRKYESFCDRITDAQALVSALIDRRANLQTRRTTAQSGLAALGHPATRNPARVQKFEAEIAAIEADIEALNHEHSRRFAELASAKAALAPLTTFVENLWLPASRGPSGLRVFKVEAPLLDGENILEALQRIRDQIFALKNEVTNLKAANLTAAEIRAKVTAEVASAAAMGCPTLNPQTGTIAWPDAALGYSPTSLPGGAHNMLAWLFPEQVLERLLDGVDDVRGIPMSERPAREAALLARLPKLEREEEACLEAAEAAGHTVQRRHDASRWAILGIDRAEQEEAAA